MGTRATPPLHPATSAITTLHASQWRRAQTLAEAEIGNRSLVNEALSSPAMLRIDSTLLKAFESKSDSIPSDPFPSGRAYKPITMGTLTGAHIFDAFSEDLKRQIAVRGNTDALVAVIDVLRPLALEGLGDEVELEVRVGAGQELFAPSRWHIDKCNRMVLTLDGKGTIVAPENASARPQPCKMTFEENWQFTAMRKSLEPALAEQRSLSEGVRSELLVKVIDWVGSQWAKAIHSPNSRCAGQAELGEVVCLWSGIVHRAPVIFDELITKCDLTSLSELNLAVRQSIADVIRALLDNSLGRRLQLVFSGVAKK